MSHGIQHRPTVIQPINESPVPLPEGPDAQAVQAHQAEQHPQMFGKARDAHRLRKVDPTKSLAGTARLVGDSPEKVREAEEVEDKAADVVTIILLMCLGERHSQMVGALR
jgi:hypothetical protein